MLMHRICCLVIILGWFGVLFGFSESVDQAEARLLESAQNEWQKLPIYAVTHAILTQETDDTKWVERGIPLVVVKAARVLELGGRTDVRYNQSVVTLTSDGEVIALAVNVTTQWECGTVSQRKTCSRTILDPAAAQATNLSEIWRYGYLYRVAGAGTEQKLQLAPITVGCRSDFTAECQRLDRLDYWNNVAQGVTPLWEIMKRAGEDGVLTRQKLARLYDKEQQEFVKMALEAAQSSASAYGHIEKHGDRYMIHLFGPPPIMPTMPRPEASPK